MTVNVRVGRLVLRPCRFHHNSQPSMLCYATYRCHSIIEQHKRGHLKVLLYPKHGRWDKARYCFENIALNLAWTQEYRREWYSTCACNMLALFPRCNERRWWSGPRAFSRIPIALRYSTSASASFPCAPDAVTTDNAGVERTGRYVSLSVPVWVPILDGGHSFRHDPQFRIEHIREFSSTALLCPKPQSRCGKDKQGKL